MKHVMIPLILTAGALAWVTAPNVSAETHKRASAPVVITPPAVHDGSNFSRAPFPAERAMNDVTPPNGEAFNQEMPPNTPSTTPAPIAPPVPSVAVLEPRTRTEPGLMPTGRPTVAASASLDASQIEPQIRQTSFEARDDLVDGLRVRLRQSELAMQEFRRSEHEMSAEGRSQFKSAADDVHARQKALEKSLRAAADSSSSNWDAARAQLASDYDAYAASLQQVDVAVGVAPPRR